MEHHNKKYVYWLCVIVIAMFVLPCAVARLASECNGMTLCIILFLVLNPVLSYWGLFVKKASNRCGVDFSGDVFFLEYGCLSK